MGSELETRPVGPADLADLARLFERQRNTRHCWCMAFCTTRGRFAVGWVAGGNRRAFEAMAAADPTPMGMLTTMAGEPVGWCACGPRSRYALDSGPQRQILAGRTREDDTLVWLLPCLFVRDGYRGQGITSALVRAAVQAARDAGAVALEGWPTTASDHDPAHGFLGRQQVFAHLGFREVGHPAQDRVIMRRELV